MSARRSEDALLPQIDHLTVDQLRRRAAEDREDALRLSTRGAAEGLSMLLADAVRCDERADELEAQHSNDDLDPLTVESAIALLVEVARGRVFGPCETGGLGAVAHRSISAIQASVERGIDGGNLYLFSACGVAGTRRGLQGGRQPTLAAAVSVALGNLRTMAKV